MFCLGVEMAVLDILIFGTAQLLQIIVGRYNSTHCVVVWLARQLAPSLELLWEILDDDFFHPSSHQNQSLSTWTSHSIGIIYRGSLLLDTTVDRQIMERDLTAKGNGFIVFLVVVDCQDKMVLYPLTKDEKPKGT